MTSPGQALGVTHVPQTTLGTLHMGENLQVVLRVSAFTMQILATPRVANVWTVGITLQGPIVNGVPPNITGTLQHYNVAHVTVRGVQGPPISLELAVLQTPWVAMSAIAHLDSLGIIVKPVRLVMLVILAMKTGLAGPVLVIKTQGMVQTIVMTSLVTACVMKDILGRNVNFVTLVTMGMQHLIIVLVSIMIILNKCEYRL